MTESPAALSSVRRLIPQEVSYYAPPPCKSVNRCGYRLYVLRVVVIMDLSRRQFRKWSTTSEFVLSLSFYCQWSRQCYVIASHSRLYSPDFSFCDLAHLQNVKVNGVLKRKTDIKI